jgi:hypothetical protein
MHSQDKSTSGIPRLRFRASFASVFASALLLANFLALYFALGDHG